MRRVCPLLALLLISALVACGGTKTANTPATGPGRVVASGSGSGSTQRDPAPMPQGAAEPSPFKLVPGLELEGVKYAALSGGGFSFSGKVVNTGQHPVHAARITLDLLDGTGQLAASLSFSTSTFPVLQPGEQADWQDSVSFATRPWQQLQPKIEGTTPDGGQ